MPRFQRDISAPLLPTSILITTYLTYRCRKVEDLIYCNLSSFRCEIVSFFNNFFFRELNLAHTLVVQEYRRQYSIIWANDMTVRKALNVREVYKRCL